MVSPGATPRQDPGGRESRAGGLGIADGSGEPTGALHRVAFLEVRSRRIISRISAAIRRARVARTASEPTWQPAVAASRATRRGDCRHHQQRDPKILVHYRNPFEWRAATKSVAVSRGNHTRSFVMCKRNTLISCLTGFADHRCLIATEIAASRWPSVDGVVRCFRNATSDCETSAANVRNLVRPSLLRRIVQGQSETPLR